MAIPSKSAPRRTDPHRWTSLGAAALSGLIVAAPMAFAQDVAMADRGAVAAEGGEAGEAGLVTAAEEDNGYPLRLSLMAAHLRVGEAVYAAGDREAALAHVPNPHHVFFEDLELEMAGSGDAGFADELARTMDLMAAGVPAAEIAPGFEKMQARLREAAARTPPLARLEIATDLLRTAADKYGSAVKCGVLEDLPEYQDALGFAQAAREIAAGVAGSDDPAVGKAGEKALAAIAATDPAFDGIFPTADALSGDASLFLGAAARVEIAALALK